jgi:class 3 adenylate cyclase
MSATASRTNGFLFADLRDYTTYVESHGDQAAAALLEAYRSLVRATVSEFGGAEIKTEGDSFYVVFPSASSAVQCGLAILDAAAASTASGGGPIRVGIGVHAGETVETSEGYVGSAVNVAARVCSQAAAGELLVTDTVRALTRTFLPVQFVDRRSRRLKGIAEPVVLYRVVPSTEATAGAIVRPRSPRKYARIGAAVIAVLVTGATVVTGYVFVAARPGQDVTPSPTALVASATFPTPDEADLLDRVPSSFRDRCVRATDDADLARATASLQCALGLSDEADTVWYHQFETAQSMSDYISGIQQAQQLKPGSCSHDVPRAQGDWRVGSTFSGRVLCYQAPDGSWIVWTYDAERILARATRSGTTADDWMGLYDWWSQQRLFLRAG